MRILSKYIAPWAIPNENIPLHVVWDSNENIQEITLIKPKTLLIKEIFNSDYIEVSDSEVKFKNFDSDGYFSIELISKEIKMLEKKCDIVLKFLKNDKILEKLNFSITIFRPILETVCIPEEIEVIKDRDEFKVRNPIELRYKGHGNVFVHVKSANSSELQIKIPAEIQKTMDKFQEDLEIGLNELKSKYPEYEKLFKSLEDDEELSLTNIETKLEIYSDIFENDNDFSEDFMKKFSYAIKENYAQLDDYIIGPFLEYIRASPIKTVYLIDPIWRFNFQENAKHLNLEINYFDLEENVYEPINISTKMFGHCKGDIDLYKIFKWVLE